MDVTRLLDRTPLWVLFLITSAVVVLSVEAGYRLGRLRRRRLEDPEKESSVGVMVSATLGLLAFTLAFTFGLAAGRFDARRQVIVEEANAVGTSYLRAAFLPEPQQSTTRRLLARIRGGAVEGRPVRRRAQSGFRVNKVTRRAMWAQAVTAARRTRDRSPPGSSSSHSTR